MIAMIANEMIAIKNIVFKLLYLTIYHDAIQPYTCAYLCAMSRKYIILYMYVLVLLYGDIKYRVIYKT